MHRIPCSCNEDDSEHAGDCLTWLHSDGCRVDSDKFLGRFQFTFDGVAHVARRGVELNQAEKKTPKSTGDFRVSNTEPSHLG